MHGKQGDSYDGRLDEGVKVILLMQMMMEAKVRPTLMMKADGSRDETDSRGESWFHDIKTMRPCQCLRGKWVRSDKMPDFYRMQLNKSHIFSEGNFQFCCKE